MSHWLLWPWVAGVKKSSNLRVSFTPQSLEVGRVGPEHSPG